MTVSWCSRNQYFIHNGAGAASSRSPRAILSTTNRKVFRRRAMRLTTVSLLILALLALPTVSPAQGVPVFAITPEQSSIAFEVDASVAIKGTFDQWTATLTFASTDATSGVLDVEI